VKILVDEMPKHCDNCPCYTYNLFNHNYVCKIDGWECGMIEKECRWFKEAGRKNREERFADI
jgi:hypothetical protein